MEITLEKRTALVCGSSSGIGKAIAMNFAAIGARVILSSRSRDKLDTVLRQLDTSHDQQHIVAPADFSKPDEAVQIILNAAAGLNVDTIINNSGGPAPGPVNQAAGSDFLDAFNAHLLFSHKLMQAFIPAMRENNFGRIINIISIGAKEPVDNLGVSNTIRGAMMSWSKTLARELAENNITVNNILPGYTATQRLDELFENNAKRRQSSKSDVKDATISTIPAKRLGHPDELAYLAAFLASDKAAYINGASIPIDGAYLHGF